MPKIGDYLKEFNN